MNIAKMVIGATLFIGGIAVFRKVMKNRRERIAMEKIAEQFSPENIHNTMNNMNIEGMVKDAFAKIDVQAIIDGAK